MLVLFTIIIRVVYQSPPPRNAVVGALLTAGLLILILGSAWLGYGPGVLVCFLVCFAVPRLIPQTNRGFQASLLQFIVLSCITPSALTKSDPVALD